MPPTVYISTDKSKKSMELADGSWLYWRHGLCPTHGLDCEGVRAIHETAGPERVVVTGGAAFQTLVDREANGDYLVEWMDGAGEAAWDAAVAAVEVL